MFWDAPADYVPTAAERDLTDRLRPTAGQIDAALDRLAELDRHTEYVYVPIALPGKTRGLWELGQPVEHPDGVFLDREEASRAAVVALGTRPGTPAYAAVWRDGGAAVFEDFRALFERDDAGAPPATTLPTGTVRLDSIPF